MTLTTRPLGENTRLQSATSSFMTSRARTRTGAWTVRRDRTGSGFAGALMVAIGERNVTARARPLALTGSRMPGVLAFFAGCRKWARRYC